MVDENKKEQKMKKNAVKFGWTLVIASALVCSTMSFAASLEVGGKIETNGKANIGTLTKVVEPPKKEAESARSFLKASLENYKMLYDKLKVNENEAKAALEKATTDSEKFDIAEKQLSQRIKLLQSLSEELNFTSEKMKKVVQSISGQIGNLKENASVANKVAEESRVTEECITKAETLQRNFRELKSKEPAPDSDEYWQWFEEVNKRELEFNDAMDKLDDSVLDGVLYKSIAKQLNVSVQNTAKWRVFAGNLSFLFTSNESKLKSEVRRSQKYMEYIQGTKNIADGTEVLNYLADIAPLMKDIEGMEMPAVPSIGDDQPPIVKLPFNIIGTDIRERVAKLEAAAVGKKTDSNDK